MIDEEMLAHWSDADLQLFITVLRTRIVTIEKPSLREGLILAIGRIEAVLLARGTRAGRPS